MKESKDEKNKKDQGWGWGKNNCLIVSEND